MDWSYRTGGVTYRATLIPAAEDGAPFHVRSRLPGSVDQIPQGLSTLKPKTQNVSHSPNLGSRHEVFGYRCWQH